MTIAIHKDRYGRFDPFCEIYEKILAYNNIDSVRVDINDAGFWDTVKTCDAFIYRWIQWDDHHMISQNIIPIIEDTLHVKCLPDSKTSFLYDNKIREFYFLQLYGYPIIKSWVFYDKRKAKQWLKSEAQFPLVFKLKGGASSKNVMLAETQDEAVKLVQTMFGAGVVDFGFWGTTRSKDFNLKKFIRHWGGNLLRRLRSEDAEPYWQINKNYVLFQQFMPGNEFDTRVLVIGQRAFAFRRRVRKNDFRASGSGLIEFDHSEIDLRCVKLALKISKEMGFASMAYDLIYDTEGNPVVCEISYTVVDTIVYNSEGYWDENLVFHEGHYWMQYFQLMDLLNLPSLKQPEDLVP